MHGRKKAERPPTEQELAALKAKRDMYAKVKALWILLVMHHYAALQQGKVLVVVDRLQTNVQLPSLQALTEHLSPFT